MPTSSYFNKFNHAGEQGLLDNLVIESIQIYGHDVKYLPRLLMNEDSVFNESTIVEYNEAIDIEVYIKGIDGFNGDSNFISKLTPGLEIRDQVTFSVARKRWLDDIEPTHTELPRPREGDLIYFPLNSKCFQIKFVDDKPFFYQLGKLQMYDLQCELFEYSGEKFSTGVDYIDSLEQNHTIDILFYAIKDEAGNPIVTEDGKYLVIESYDETNALASIDNQNIQDDASAFLDFSETNPFSEDGY